MNDRSPNLDALLDADTLAIVGASDNFDSISGRPLYFLDKHGFEGDVYPVNPNHDELRGRRCYDSVLDIPSEVDLALIAVPARIVPSVLEECGQKGIPFNIILSSGFSEIGESGESLENEILDIADSHGIRVIGPNSQGFVNLEKSLTMCFSSMLYLDNLRTEEGIAIVSQSGAFGGAIFQMAQRENIGVKYWVGTGNEIDLTAVDFIDKMVEDPDVSLVIGYIEAIKQGERFKRVARKAIEHETPILFMHVGRSQRGRAAVRSHIGKIAGRFDVYGAVFEELGVQRLESVNDFKDSVKAFPNVPVSRYPVDGNVAILSLSGGAGVLITDACERHGVSIADLDERTRDQLDEVIPLYGSSLNPVDLTADVVNDTEMFRDSIETTLADDNVESLIIQLTNSAGPLAEEHFEFIADVTESYDKLVLLVYTGGLPTDDVLYSYHEAGIPTFEDPVSAVRSVNKLTSFKNKTLESDAALQEPSRSRDSPSLAGVDPTSWDELRAVARDADLPLVRGRVTTTPDEAVETAATYGYPVVMKAAGSGLDHKTELNAIEMDVCSAEDVRHTFDALVERVSAHDADVEVDGVLVQEQVADGLEVIVGVTTDTDFGPVIMAGMGGIFAEALDEVSYRTLPLTEHSARDLIESTKLGTIFSDQRGASYDIDALESLLLSVSDLYEANSDVIEELDLNPVMVREDGVSIVDMLLVTED